VPAIVCTADSWGVEDVRADLDGLGNVSVLVKPFSIEDLYRVVGHAAEI
jgi:hypothetical protein